MKTFYIIISLLFAVFITLYISQATGYYNYEQYKKTELTKDKIEQFERDVADGKNVDIKDYLENVKVDYSNTASNTGLKISNTITKYVKSGVNGTLFFFSLLLGE
jgi:YbbR domain-containing protein